MAVIKLLADDTKTFQEIRSDPTTHEEDRAALQQRINAMAEWAVTNDMVYHQDKVKRMHVGQQNPKLPYYLNGQEIRMVEEEKDIGFWVTKDLMPAIHVRKARGREMGELSRIRPPEKL